MKEYIQRMENRNRNAKTWVSYDSIIAECSNKQTSAHKISEQQMWKNRMRLSHRISVSLFPSGVLFTSVCACISFFVIVIWPVSCAFYSFIHLDAVCWCCSHLKRAKYTKCFARVIYALFVGALSCETIALRHRLPTFIVTILFSRRSSKNSFVQNV